MHSLKHYDLTTLEFNSLNAARLSTYMSIAEGRSKKCASFLLPNWLHKRCLYLVITEKCLDHQKIRHNQYSSSLCFIRKYWDNITPHNRIYHRFISSIRLLQSVILDVLEYRVHRGERNCQIHKSVVKILILTKTRYYKMKKNTSKIFYETVAMEQTKVSWHASFSRFGFSKE